MKLGLLVLFRARHIEPTEEQVERMLEEILSGGKA
jgi:hypothetical protein